MRARARARKWRPSCSRLALRLTMSSQPASDLNFGPESGRVPFGRPEALPLPILVLLLLYLGLRGYWIYLDGSNGQAADALGPSLLSPSLVSPLEPPTTRS